MICPPAEGDAGPTLQDAIDGHRDGTVVLAPGVWRIESQVVIPHPVHIRGQGPATRLELYGPPIIVGDEGDSWRGGSLEKVVIVSAHTDATIGLQLGYVSRTNQPVQFAVRDVEVTGFSDAGIWDVCSQGFRFDNLRLHHNQNGYREDGEAHCVAHSFRDCYVRQNTSWGVVLKAARGFLFDGGVIEANEAGGFLVHMTQAVTHLHLRGVRFESNGGSYAISIDRSNTDAQLRRCHIDGCHVGYLEGGNGVLMRYARESSVRWCGFAAVGCDVRGQDNESVWVIGCSDGADVSPDAGMMVVPFLGQPDGATLRVLGSGLELKP